MSDLKVIYDRLEALEKTLELCEVLKAIQKEVVSSLDAVRSGSARAEDLSVLRLSEGLVIGLEEINRSSHWLWQISIAFPKKEKVEKVLEKAKELLEKIQEARLSPGRLGLSPEEAFSEGVSSALFAERVFALINEALKGIDEEEKKEFLKRLEAEKEALCEKTLKKLSSPSRPNSKKVL